MFTDCEKISKQFNKQQQINIIRQFKRKSFDLRPFLTEKNKKKIKQNRKNQVVYSSFRIK